MYHLLNMHSMKIGEFVIFLINEKNYSPFHSGELFLTKDVAPSIRSLLS